MTRLEEFNAKWNESTAVQATGDLSQRDKLRNEAKDIAALFVKENEERLEIIYGENTLEELVKLVDFYREQGLTDKVLEIDMWLLTNFEPQKIGGQANVTVRRKK